VTRLLLAHVEPCERGGFGGHRHHRRSESAGSPGRVELALLAAEFPAFRFWRQTYYDRTLYIAQSTSLSTRPHAVVTDDLGELRAALTAGQPPGR
jgi:hypothetical protein